MAVLKEEFGWYIKEFIYHTYLPTKINIFKLGDSNIYDWEKGNGIRLVTITTPASDTLLIDDGDIGHIYKINIFSLF